ncbi:MAG TPA: 4-hydroxybenzoate octaprenyltransferase [Burkholderiaceae bacterium]|nr:4-hydroxybenzoate octaprenyltransferase [Burkholderiaceae bacterium]
MKNRLRLYARLIRLDKPIGTLLLLWPTCWALWFAANGVPPWHVLAIFVVGTFLMRSAGCAVNDVADRRFDRHVARTRERPVTSGALPAREAMLVAVVLTLVAGALILPLNYLVWALSVVAVLIAATYPLFKRFFAIPQAYLGVAFSLGIPMAFAAVRGELPPIVWLMLLANLSWVVAYDTEYALVDIADDLKIGIKTSAITFGRYAVPAIALCYAGFIGLMAWLGVITQRGLAYYLGLVAASLIALTHVRAIRGRDPAACFAAFRGNHWLGFVVFLGTVIDFANI